LPRRCQDTKVHKGSENDQQFFAAFWNLPLRTLREMYLFIFVQEFLQTLFCASNLKSSI
jgi:hypothetical protein